MNRVLSKWPNTPSLLGLAANQPNEKESVMTQKKIAVTNFSGNTGKSMLSKHVILPRLTNATLLNIESLNDGIAGGERLRGEQFGLIQDRVLDCGNIVLDVGASNVEAFIEAMAEYDGSHEDIDVFVIPVVPETKQQIDTIATIKALTTMGVSADKIRVVFNRTPKRTTVRDAFPAIFGFHLQSGEAFRIDEAVAIPDSEVFDLLKLLCESLVDMATDPTDYKAALANASGEHEALFIKSKIKAQRLARPMGATLDKVFDFITA
jgi:hypothetical protein